MAVRHINRGGYVIVSVIPYVYEHRKVWADAYGPIPKGMVVHHKNGNKTDNRLENLELMSRGKHTQLHYPRHFCSICGDPVTGHGLCVRHYTQQRRYGRPLLDSEVGKRNFLKSLKRQAT